MLSKEKIQQKIKVITREKSMLEEFKNIPEDNFNSNDNITEYYAALRHLQLCLQACLDIAQHIAAHSMYDDYKQNKDVFKILASKKILTSNTASAFESATGVRNINTKRWMIA